MILLLVFVRGVAQTGDAPVFFTTEGNLWRWDIDADELTRSTETGFVHTIELSPDGSLLVYNVQSSFDTFSDVSGAIWLLDIATNEARQLAGGEGYYRSPTWSPDGSQLAWNENHQLTIYTLATEERVQVARLPGGWGDGGLIATARISWGETGIITTDPFIGSSIIEGLNNGLRIYAPDGEIIYNGEIGNEFLNHNYGRAPVWVETTDGEALAVPYADSDGMWEVFPPDSERLRESIAVSGDIGLFSIAQPDRAPLLIRTPELTHQLVHPETEPVLPSRFMGAALSPDGTELLYVGDGLFRWRDGVSEAVDLGLPFGYANEIVWGRTEWRFIDPEPIEPVDTLPECSPEVDRRYWEDYRAGDTLRIEQFYLLLYRRTYPLRLGDITLEPGDTFTLEAGPFCPPDTPIQPWWRVSSGENEGWTTLEVFRPETFTLIERSG